MNHFCANISGIRGRRQRGFTLIEMLVTIAIIALLASLAFPILIAANRKAKQTRQAADLQAISSALDAYHSLFQEYPPVNIPGTGFAVLCKALISPGPASGPLPGLGNAPYVAGTYTSSGTFGTPGYTEFVAFGKPDPAGGFDTTSGISDLTTWAPFPVSDGLNGPGFKVRFGGQPQISFLQPEKFKVSGLAMFDIWGNPILYFPARPGKIAQDTTGAKTWALITGGAGSVYDITNNITFFLRPGETVAANANNALARMDAAIVRDSANFNGIIENGETPQTTGPYLLWSAGADGNFGVTYNTAAPPTKTDITKCDDVTNFERQ